MLIAGPEQCTWIMPICEKNTIDYFTASEYDADIMERFYPGITLQTVEEMRDMLHYNQNFEMANL